MNIDIKSLEKESYRILSDISINFDEEEVVILFGRNGAGKSSLFKCILGLEQSYTGRILFNKNEIEVNRSALHFGYLPENESIPSEFLVTSLISAFRVATKIKENSLAVSFYDEIFEGLKIEPLLKKPFGNISKGEKKRVLLMLALMVDYDILILDEPFENLDYEMKTNVFKLIMKTRDYGDKQKLILISTHQLDPIDNGIDIAVFLNHGKIEGLFRKSDYPDGGIVKQLRNLTKFS